MVEAVSNSTSSEGIEVSEYPSIEKAAPEEVKKEIADQKGSSKDRLTQFLKHGGAQEDYLELLKCLYGDKLVEKAFPKEWKDPLTKEHCVEILERVGHGITLDDLEGYYAELKSSDIKCEILKYAMVPYLRMWRAGSVQELPPYWMSHFIDLFRNPLKELEIEVGFDKINYINREARLYTYYGRQVSSLMKNGDRSRPEFFFASRELLAKSIAYAAPQSVVDGAVIPVFNEEIGRQVFYTLKGQIHDSGLHAYLFVPIEGSARYPAQLIFRGTNGSASVGRDLDSKGIGKRVFAANKNKIEALVKEAKATKIEVIGHSLGAADAQRAVALLVDPRFAFNFNEISLFAFCAPKLEIERVNRWKEDLKVLAENNNHPVIRLNFAQHESDAVTWTGDSYLSGAELDFIYSNYLTVSSNSGAMQTPAHHTTAFFLDGNFNFDIDGRTFELKKSFPNSELLSQIQKLEEIRNAWQWWRGVKSYFVKVETKEEIKKRIEEIKQHQAEISEMEKGGSQHSWMVYMGWNAVRYTVQPVVYFTFEGIRAIGEWRR